MGCPLTRRAAARPDRPRAHREAGGAHPRLCDPASVQGPAQRKVVKIAGTDVSDSRKAGHQSPLGIPNTEDRAKGIDIPYSGIVALRIAERSSNDVRMSVDKPRHQSSITKIDRSRTCWDRNTGKRTDRHYLVIANHDRSVPYRFTACAVDDPRGFDDYNAAALFLSGRSELLPADEGR